MTPDPIVLAAAIGVLGSPLAGRVVLRSLEASSPRRRRRLTWSLVGGVVALAVAGSLVTRGWVIFLFLLGLLPGTFAFLALRTAYASAVVSIVPLYFGVGPQTLGLPLHRPGLALDRALPLQPQWMLVYGSLWVFVLLPFLVARQRPLLRRAMQAYLTVLLVAYVGFVLYPTVAPRPLAVVGSGFAAWSLRLQYALDQPYDCFPSLHVAHSFVSALTAYRVNRQVGLVAIAWAALIAVSTLFTKQHYVVDVVAGALAAYLAYVCFLRGFPREAVDEKDRRQAPIRALAVVGIFGVLILACWGLYRTGVVL